MSCLRVVMLFWMETLLCICCSCGHKLSPQTPCSIAQGSHRTQCLRNTPLSPGPWPLCQKSAQKQREKERGREAERERERGERLGTIRYESCADIIYFTRMATEQDSILKRRRTSKGIRRRTHRHESSNGKPRTDFYYNKKMIWWYSKATRQKNFYLYCLVSFTALLCQDGTQLI